MSLYVCYVSPFISLTFLACVLTCLIPHGNNATRVSTASGLTSGTQPPLFLSVTRWTLGEPFLPISCQTKPVRITPYTARCSALPLPEPSVTTWYPCVSVCPPSQFKHTVGNSSCRACPDHSSASYAASVQCHCEADYHRAAKDPRDAPCTRE